MLPPYPTKYPLGVSAQTASNRQAVKHSQSGCVSLRRGSVDLINGITLSRQPRRLAHPPASLHPMVSLLHRFSPLGRRRP